MKIITGHWHHQYETEHEGHILYTVGNSKRKTDLDFLTISTKGEIKQLNYVNGDRLKSKQAVGVVSDLHLQGGKANDNEHKDEDIAKMLKHVIDKCETTIILGDIVDLAQPERFGDYQSELENAREAYPESIALIDKFKVKIYGNHDYEMKNEGWKRDHKLKIAGEEFYLLHGHQYDKLESSELGLALSRIVLYLVGRMERMFPDVDKLLENVIDGNMEKLSGQLKKLVGKGKEALVNEIMSLVNEMREDAENVTREYGRRFQKHLTELATGKIKAQDFESYMRSMHSLLKMQAEKQAVRTKAKIQRVIDFFEDLIINKLLGILKTLF